MHPWTLFMEYVCLHACVCVFVCVCKYDFYKVHLERATRKPQIGVSTLGKVRVCYVPGVILWRL